MRRIQVTVSAWQARPGCGDGRELRTSRESYEPVLPGYFLAVKVVVSIEIKYKWQAILGQQRGTVGHPEMQVWAC